MIDPLMTQNTYRNITAETRAVGDTGEVEAVISAFGVVDSYATRAPRVFWEKMLAKNPDPIICWGHNFERPIGRTQRMEFAEPYDSRLTEIAKPNGGLIDHMRLNLETSDGRDMYQLIKAGDVREWSFAIADARFEANPVDGVMEFVDGILLEVSPVFKGSNPATNNVSVRSNGKRLADQVNDWVSEGENLVGRLSDLHDQRSYISPASIDRLDILTSTIEKVKASAAVRDANGASDAKRLELRKQIALELTNYVQPSESKGGAG